MVAHADAPLRGALYSAAVTKGLSRFALNICSESLIGTSEQAADQRTLLRDGWVAWI